MKAKSHDDRPLLSLSLDELAEVCSTLELERYRARQIWKWIFHKQVLDFAAMTNLPQAAREKLAARFPVVLSAPSSDQHSNDGTRKLALPLADGSLVEAVAIPDDRDGVTFCLSSQVGCPIGCLFCRTGQLGFTRNLASHEILTQVLALSRAVGKRPDHIVFMGMGEPLLNPEAVRNAIGVLTDRAGLRLGSRRITVSTAGIPAEIRAMTEWPGEVNLAVSLHAAVDDLRRKLVPLNKRHDLAALRAAVVDYLAATNRRVTFEMVMIAGVNDGEPEAMNLASYCTDLLCHVNLIAFNPFAGCALRPSSPETIKQFRKVLKKAGIATTIRTSRGGDISAACGQLAGECENGKEGSSKE